MDERGKIVEFLLFTDSWLKKILEPRAFNYLFPYQKDMAYKAHNAYEIAIIRLNGSISYINKSNEEDFSKQLLAHGLTGPEWDFKIEIINHFSNEATSRIENIPFEYDGKWDAEINKQRGILRKIIKKMLKGIDVILGSLIDSGIPMLHPYKEFKEAIETLLE